MSDLHNILEHDDELSAEELLKYLQGNLSDKERHETEKKLVDSPFADEALQGLQAFKNKKNIQKYVDELNKQLQKQTTQKKKRQQKRKLKGMDWLMITIVIVLLLCFLGYWAIHLQQSIKKNAIENTTNKK